MAIRSIIHLLFTILIILQFTSCKEDRKLKSLDPWANTTWFNLDNESIALRIPNNFKKSSRFRLKEDMAYQTKDSSQLLFMQNALENLEFNDSQIDVFVDTTSQFHLAVICNLPKFDFRRKDILVAKTFPLNVNESSGRPIPCPRWNTLCTINN